MADSTTMYRFDTLAGLALAAAFDGGRLTSDGGLVWLAEADRALGLCAALAACVPEWRRGPVRHSLETLVRQRVFPIACGYADQDDAASLRADPLLKLVCARAPESGADLASQPTLSRLENAVDRHAVEALAEALVALYVRERGAGGAGAARLRQHRRPGPRAAGGGWPTTATTGSIGTTRCSSSTATPARWWRSCCARATPTAAASRSWSCAAWCAA